MRFAPTDDQRDFVASLDALLASAGTVAAARAWGEGDTAPGLALWGRLAEQGVPALVVPEDAGGLGATRVELALAFELLGRHGVPGPWVETAAFLPAATRDPAVLGAVCEGTPATVAVPPHVPLALDADVVDPALVFVAGDGVLRRASVGGGPRTGVDPTRRLFALAREDGDALPADVEAGLAAASLATAAMLLGAGERVLADSVAYVLQRKQFGRQIGSYQAVKHRLADVRIQLDFARPLVHAAALGEVSPSAAKVLAGEAAYLAARTGLQVHGAVGYTRELDLSIWLTRIRALLSAWGTPAHHRGALLAEITR